MPPTFCSRSIRSFGHLQVTRRPAVARIASAMQAPASKESSPARAGGSAGRSTNEHSSEPSLTSVQVRPSRARPSVWCAADTSVHSGDPASASSIAVAFVEPVTSSARTGASTGIAASAASRSSRLNMPGAGGARGPWKARYASDEQTEGPDREPRRDRGTDHPHLSRDGHPVGGRVLRCRPRRAARRDGRRGVSHRPRARVGFLSLDRRDPRGGSGVEGDARAPRLRLPRRARAFRAGRRRSGLHVHRPLAPGDRGDGRQVGGAPARRRRRHADRARDAGARRRRRGEGAGAPRRVPDAREGGVRWRRQGHARRARRAASRGFAQAGGARGAVVLRAARGLPGALRRSRTSHRGADHRRHARQRRVPGRTRLLRAAPPPEADRGDALRAGRRRVARAVRRGGARARSRGELRQRGHDRMHPGRGGLLLLPRDEHAAAGRAHRDRDGDGPGHRGAADRGGARLLDRRPRGVTARPRDPVPDQRGGPGTQLPAGARADHALRGTRRPVRARSTRASRRAGTSRATTTRCSPS